MKILRPVLVIFLILFLLKGFAQEKGKVTYKYKKFQEFDLETLSVEGEVGSPGDLSAESRFQRAFKNKLPLRKNFNPEIRRSVEVIR